MEVFIKQLLGFEKVYDKADADAEEVKEKTVECLCNLIVSFEKVNSEIKALLKTEGYRCNMAHENIVGENELLSNQVLINFCAENDSELSPEQAEMILMKFGDQANLDKDVLTKFLRGNWAQVTDTPPMLLPYARYTNE